MYFQESETIELKEVVVDDIKKEIIAFANCDGGKIYIGIRDDGSIVGLENPDETALQVSNMVRDAIKPDITMFVHYKTIEVDTQKVVMVDVQRGTERPYYIARKGLRPEGVYVRQGYSSVPATDTAIRSMIKETDGDSFEAMRCLDQNLTFDVTSKEFQKRNIELGSKQMQTLKITDHEGIYSNLGLLLSDQCIHTIKVAVFQGTDQTVFKDRREFSGSLLKQMNDVYEFIDFRNQTRATIEKLMRTDIRDYPEVAIRETLLNMMVHRDYSFSASALISIYDDRIEFVSIGGLLPGIELEDVMVGLSVCRNQNLANVFYRLRLIEAYGTGIRKIIRAYEKTGFKPEIETTQNTFKVVLPNINVERTKTLTDIVDVEKRNLKVEDSLGIREKKILEYVKENGFITRVEAEHLLKTSSSTASRILRKMVKNKNLLPIGKARDTKYISI